MMTFFIFHPSHHVHPDINFQDGHDGKDGKEYKISRNL